MASAYLSCFDYALSPSGIEYNSLVANMTRVADSGVLAGATTLPVIPPGIQTTLNRYDRVSIFDGSSSEQVLVTVSTDTTGVQEIQCSPLQYAHVAGTPICSDGFLGSLATTIFAASQQLETICRQSLFLTTYTNELLAIPTMRAAIDNHYALHFRPRHWPIDSLTSLSITTVPGSTISYDPTQVIIDSDKQICSMPNMQPLPLAGSGQAPYPIWNTVSRLQQAQLTIAYQAGFSTMPADVIEAAVLLTSDILAKRLNPVGAPDIASGDRHISAVLRGDNSGQSLLVKRAQQILDNYTMQSF
jgi:hypothetical protein